MRDPIDQNLNEIDLTSCNSLESQLDAVLYMANKFELYDALEYLQKVLSENKGEYIPRSKITLYGSNLSCPCGCKTQTYIFLTSEEATLCCSGTRMKNVRMIELANCEPIGKERYVYNNFVLHLGFNEIDLEGDRILKFFNVK
jgi:hypothetical protein